LLLSRYSKHSVSTIPWLLGCVALGLFWAAAGLSQEHPLTLRIAVPRLKSRDFRSLGTRDPEKMLQALQPLARYLEARTGAKIEITVPVDRAKVIAAMQRNELDIAHFGGLEYVQASADIGVKPLVQQDRDREWRTVFITQVDSPIHQLKDLAGHSFAFSEKSSVSSHVMPEYWMREAKIDPGVYQNAIYTGSHESTVLAVASRKADAGALDKDVVEEMIADGKVAKDQIRVFWEPHSYFNAVWAARPGLDPSAAESFAKAMIALDPRKPESKEILNLLAATRYVPAKDSGYALLRKAVKADGLLDR
jgi:phosphonate transport system substrate-binding protein